MGRRGATRACSSTSACRSLWQPLRRRSNAGDTSRAHFWIDDQLHGVGAHVDATYHCPHHLSAALGDLLRECDCRKPAPGMLLQAIAEWQPDVGASFLIRDKATDIGAATAAGVRGVLYARGDVDAVVRGLLESSGPMV